MSGRSGTKLFYSYAAAELIDFTVLRFHIYLFLLLGSSGSIYGSMLVAFLFAVLMKACSSTMVMVIALLVAIAVALLLLWCAALCCAVLCFPALCCAVLCCAVLLLLLLLLLLQGESGEGDALTPQDIEDLKQKCRDYCDDPDPNSSLNIGKCLCLTCSRDIDFPISRFLSHSSTLLYVSLSPVCLSLSLFCFGFQTLKSGALTLTKIKDAFVIFKNIVLEGRAAGGGGGGGAGPSAPATPAQEEMAKQIKELKACLLQRDNEIAILVNMVKKGMSAEDVTVAARSPFGNRDDTMGMGGARGGPATMGSRSAGGGVGGGMGSGLDDSRLASFASEHSELEAKELRAKPAGEPQLAPLQLQQQREKEKEERLIQRHLFGVPPPPDRATFDDSAASFEWFRER